MDDLKITLFTQDGCITDTAMTAYLNGKLSHSDQHKIESHLLDCELCSDAMDGLQLIKDSGKLPGIFTELKDEIHSKSNGGEAKVRVMIPWQFAAAIALIVCSTALLFIFLPKQNQEQIFSEEYKPYPAETTPAPLPTPLSQNDSISQPVETESAPAATRETGPLQKINQQQVSSNRMEKTVESEVNESKNNPEPVTAAKDVDQNSISEETAFSSMNVEEQSVEENVTMAAPATVNTQSGNMETDSKKSLSEIQATSVSKEKYRPSVSPFDAAMKVYADSQYAKAAVMFDKISGRNDAKFYAGVSWLSAGESSKSIRRLNDYYNTGDIQHREASLWYLALAYIREKENTKARAVLNQIPPMNGIYKQQAVELLEKL